MPKPKTAREQAQERIDVARYNEAMFGDLRAAKGIAAPVIADLPPKRILNPRTGPSEHQEQVRVIQWWAWSCTSYKLPVFALLAIPNGGARDAITGSRLKAEGVRPGAPDLLLTVPRRGVSALFLELKRQGGRMSPAQEKVVFWLNTHGYICEVCHGADEAINAIKSYLEGA